MWRSRVVGAVFAVAGPAAVITGAGGPARAMIVLDILAALSFGTLTAFGYVAAGLLCAAAGVVPSAVFALTRFTR
ncbi:hypothetical protein J2Z21_002983 [Streptomyces griseochromogenes]|uniref:Uncharacterized protein n=1 Tax=Streptomyces griseochromogenes TaxID=68214 RepID=A0A1B1AXL2_9ACTN|nr:hypothetical protein [Streptomyces griseochromogenes]ANP51267.1 hypothetical protein AVL59_18015 [Streptomyces griseochromogenes]MBP2050047.1 hypothetical protein [Streptomyces griseochromogenes]